MSTRSPTVDVLEVLSRYAAGYFPLYDLEGNFYWERFPVRAIIPVNDHTLALAKKMYRRAAFTKAQTPRFQIRYTTSVEEVIAYLRQENVKPNSWVKEQVVAIYRALHNVGMLHTVEAFDPTSGKLVGGVLGLTLPGTFIAETMFSLVPEASKVCLCQLIQNSHAAGLKIIDVQTPHDLDCFGDPINLQGKTAHPCIRLGEQKLSISAFLRDFRSAWKQSFSGGIREWLAHCMTQDRTRSVSAANEPFPH